MDTLRTWNFAAAALHASAAIISNELIKPSSQSKRTVNMCKLAFDETVVTDSRVDIPIKLQDDVVIDLKVLLILFFAITSVAHLLYALNFRGFYSNTVLGYGWNPYRWAEYSLSAGIMTYLITIVSGTKEQVSAIASALIVPSLMVNGLTTERALNQNALHFASLKPGRRANIDGVIIWSQILPSWFLFFTNWFIILSNYWRLSKQAKDAGKPFDSNVQFMVYSQLFFFSMFGLIMSYQVYRWATARSGRIEPKFIVYEKAYIILSAVTKLVLAATIVNAIRD